MPAEWKALLALIAKELAKKIGGGWTWGIELVLKYGGQYLWDAISKFIKVEKREGEQKEALEKLEETVKKPESTVEERAKAYEDAINAGRK